MSKAAKKPFIVRGFNVTSGNFDCTDVMSRFPTFTEVTVDRQHEAVVEMTTNSNIHTMSTRNLIITNANGASSALLPIADEAKELYVVDLVIVTGASSVNDLRHQRTAIRETLKTWTEKSRVTGRRGWRSNAIKTPTFEFDKTEQSVVIRTQVILSTAIFYNDHMSTVNVNFEPLMEQEDLRNLHRALVKVMGGMYSHLKYRHSEIGDGEVV